VNLTDAEVTGSPAFGGDDKQRDGAHLA
jgi:hypothetical protein